MFVRLEKFTRKYIMNSGVACAFDVIKSHVANAQSFCLSLIKAGATSEDNRKQNVNVENVPFAVSKLLSCRCRFY